MAKNEVTDKRARRYIRILNIDLWEKIDEISKDEKYGKSFNLIINDALFYGLPILYDKVFGTGEEMSKERLPKRQIKVDEPTGEERETYKLLTEIVCCLKEIMLTGNINKSMLSSIFRTCEYDHSGQTVATEKLHAGQYGNTPDYLEIYELKGLKDIWGKKK